ncbi:MAG: pyridoxal kinase [Pseudomonadota bacterium]
MSIIVSISSQVVRGSVGNSVTSFALQRLGHTVWQIPTVLFSNHPGLGDVAGRTMPVDEVRALWRGLADKGWATRIDAVLSGYIASADVAGLVAEIVDTVKMARPDATYLCDPAIGDEPMGLYVPEAAAVAIRDSLLARANIATPNRFELSWLTRQAIAGNADEAQYALKALGVAQSIATSVPHEDGRQLANVLWSHEALRVAATDRQSKVPHGTGDLFAGLYLGFRLGGAGPSDALDAATRRADAVIRCSVGQEDLAITDAGAWSDVSSLRGPD